MNMGFLWITVRTTQNPEDTFNLETALCWRTFRTDVETDYNKVNQYCIRCIFIAEVFLHISHISIYKHPTIVYAKAINYCGVSIIKIAIYSRISKSFQIY